MTRKRRRIKRAITITLSIIVLSFILGATIARGGVGYALTLDEKWGQAQTLQEIQDKAEKLQKEIRWLGIEQKAIVSAYNAEEGQTDDTPFIMANGRRVHEQAVANNCHPFGTKVIIDGQTYTVEDRMNRRYGCEYFDRFMWSKKEAIDFGRQKLPVIIIQG